MWLFLCLAVFAIAAFSGLIWYMMSTLGFACKPNIIDQAHILQWENGVPVRLNQPMPQYEDFVSLSALQKDISDKMAATMEKVLTNENALLEKLKPLGITDLMAGKWENVKSISFAGAYVGSGQLHPDFEWDTADSALEDDKNYRIPMFRSLLAKVSTLKNAGLGTESIYPSTGLGPYPVSTGLGFGPWSGA